MAKQAAPSSIDLEKQAKREARRRKWEKGKTTRVLTLMALPPAFLIFLFNYAPMTGLILAFKNFRIVDGIYGSPWVDPWYKNFVFFFKSSDAWIILRNTIGMNLIFIFLTLIVSVAMAIMINELKTRTTVKFVQTIMFFPYFLSWVVVSYMLYAFLNHNYGIINTVLSALGLPGITWYSESKYWPYILAFMYIWKNAGYNAVIYYASIMGIDDTLYEAASLDGANRAQSIWHITLPMLKQIILVLTILAIGKVMYADFGMFYMLPRNNGALFATTDVLDTYIYRMLRETGNIAVSSAVGFFQAIVGFLLIVGSNAVARRIDRDSAIF